jgi:HK97 family phage major capsid protein
MTIQELLEKKGQLANEAKGILDVAVNESRMDLRSDEEQKFEALHVDIDKITKQIERLSKTDAALATLEVPGEGRKALAPSPTRPQTRSGRTITEHDRCEAFRAWALAGSRSRTPSDTERDLATRCGFNLEASEIEIPIFGPVPMRSLAEADLRAWSLRIEEQRAALTGAQATTTTGGYTVADAAMRALEVALLQFGGMRTVATVLRTDTGGPLPVPTTNDTANKGVILAENTTATELEMTFGQVVLDAYKYSSRYILASVEFLQDTSINVAEFIGNALGNRIGRIHNDHFTTGTGTGQPNGIVTAAASGVTGTADPPTHDNLQDLIHSIDPAYRGNARFMMHDLTLKSLKKIKVLQYSGDVSGMPLWQPGLTLGAPDTILGYAYTINQSMAPPGATAKKILFGDFTKYLIRDTRDVTLIRLDERFAELHQVAFLAFARADGDLIDAGTNPVKYLAQT